MGQKDAFSINSPLFDIPGLPEDSNRRAAAIIQGEESGNKVREGFRVAPYYGSKKEKSKDIMTTGYGQTFKGSSPPDYSGKGLPTVQERLVPLSESIDKAIGSGSPLSKDQVTEGLKTQFKLFGDNAGQARMENALAIYKARGLDAANEYMHSITGGPDVKKGLTARRDYEESIGREQYNPITNPVVSSSGQVPMLSDSSRIREFNLAHQTPMGAEPVRDFNRDMVQTMGNNPDVDTDINGNIINPNIESKASFAQPEEEKKSTLPIEQVQKAHAEQVEQQKQSLENHPLNDMLKRSPVFNKALDDYETATMNAANLLAGGMMDKAMIESGAADNAFEQLKNFQNNSQANYDNFMKNMDQLDEHINKNRFIDNMPIANKILMGVSLFAGAFTRDRQNAALDMVQSEIQKDMDRQKLEYERGKEKAENIYNIASKFTNDTWERNKLAEQIMYQMAAARLDMAKAQSLPMQTKAAIDQMKAQFLGLGNKDALEMLQKQLNISKTMQEMDINKTKIGMELGKAVITDPITGKTLGNVPDSTEAREIRSLTAKTATALESIKNLRNELMQSSRLGNWLNPASKNDMSLKIQSIINTLDLASQSSPNARLPVSEIRNLGKIFEEVTKGKNITKYGPKYFIDELDKIMNHTKYGYKMRMYTSGLTSPDFANEIEALPQERK